MSGLHWSAEYRFSFHLWTHFGVMIPSLSMSIAVFDRSETAFWARGGISRSSISYAWRNYDSGSLNIATELSLDSQYAKWRFHFRAEVRQRHHDAGLERWRWLLARRLGDALSFHFACSSMRRIMREPKVVSEICFFIIIKSFHWFRLGRFN